MTPDPTAQLNSKTPLVSIYRQAAAEGISLKQLHQQVWDILRKYSLTNQIETQELQLRQQQFLHQTPLSIRVLAGVVPIVSVVLGFVFLLNAVGPLAAYYVSPDVSEANQLSPLPSGYVQRFFQPSASISAVAAKSPEPVMLEQELMYTNLANWFPSIDPVVEAQLAQNVLDGDPESEYTLDIPKLEIEQAVVKIGGTDLNQNLIQYPGTADPGQLGSPVLFGHSVLRQFYNPSIKNPRRYFSIFSKIMTLKEGDEIFVTRGGIKYTYQVKEKKEVHPEDVYILQQEFDHRQLKLVTCVPEGTYLRRGVVTAVLKD